jgi:DNA-binding NarL/FixJ family response regulator
MTNSIKEPVPAVRVMVVDDQRLMRDGIASLLSIQDGITVVGTAADGQAAIEKATVLQPDVVLMDVRMPVLDGVTATARIRRELPTCQVLMLTTFDDQEYVLEALRAGATGYLLKDLPAQDLAHAIHAAHKRIYQLDPAIAQKVVATLFTAGQTGQPSAPLDHETAAVLQPPSDLSHRELEVVRLIATGATNREIAEKLVISEGTVKNHISNILSRLGLRDRTQAAIYAREHGLL